MTHGGWLLLPAVALCILMTTTGAAAAEPPAVVTVRESGGVYTVTAQLFAKQDPSAALAVLTDYENIPRFLPDVRVSVVRQRGNGHAIVEQEAVSSLLMLSKRVHLVLDIEEREDALVFRDVCGRSFERYEGAWHLSPQDGHTVVTYELTAKPSFDAPGFMIARLLRRDSTRMIDSLWREIVARSGSPAGPTLP